MDKRRFLSWVEAVGFLFLASWLIMPSRNTAKLLNDMSAGFNDMIKAATGIRDHDPRAVEQYKALPANLQASIWGALSPADRMWVVAVMSGTEIT